MRRGFSISRETLAILVFVAAIALAAGSSIAGNGWGLRGSVAEPRQGSANADKVHLVLLGTTDLHGRIEPLDYWTNKPANLGLAKIATLVHQVRAEQPNVLLFDSGDAIQGTPLAYYFARKEPSRINPMILAMNALDYDAMAVGNHEFNFGLGLLLKVKAQAHFPILGANVRSGCRECANYFQPYIIKRVAGLRVGIVGFVTPIIPSFEIPENYKGYTFEPIVEAAQRVIPEVRRQSDVVIVLSHSGLGPDPEAGTGGDPRYLDLPGEQATIELAEKVPGIDVILFGHTHQELAGRVIHGALLVQAKNWGASLARVDMDVDRDGEGHWRVQEKRSTLVPVTAATAADPAIERLNEPYERATQTYLDARVASVAKTLSGETERYEDGPLVDLIQKVQIAYGHADVSLATMFVPTMRIQAGDVTVRQASELYPYDNLLYVVQMSGAQLRQALEHAASFYSGWPLGAGEKVHLPGYYADSAEGTGVSYAIDLTRPVGNRIVGLQYHGAPIDPAAKLRVAVNNYRYSGGGGYDYKSLPVLYRSPQEMRDLVIEYLTSTGKIPVEADHHWRIVPEEAVAAMLRAAQFEDRTGSLPMRGPLFAHMGDGRTAERTGETPFTSGLGASSMRQMLSLGQSGGISGETY